MVPHIFILSIFISWYIFKNLSLNVRGIEPAQRENSLRKFPCTKYTVQTHLISFVLLTDNMFQI